ncbi:Protein gir2 [Thecaphora frezii]
MPSQEEHEQVLAEELEVLESIYIDELEEISAEELRIRIEPEEDVVPAILSVGVPVGETAPELEEGAPKPVELSLRIRYTADYPDQPPDIRIFVVRDTKGVLGEATEEDLEVPQDEKDEEEARESIKKLAEDLHEVAQESLGMAMVFTLASHLRESLTTYIQTRIEQLEAEESARREAELEAEAEKFRGTAVTPERFQEWRRAFELEMKAKARQEEEVKMAKMSPKEREEYKKAKIKPTGRQLFEKGGSFVEDEKEEDGVQELDWSLYSREQREKERIEEEQRRELEEQAQRLDLAGDDDE